MSYGISPQVPLSNPESDGAYGLNKTIPEAVQQNIKHLLLTNPGEKMMDPGFGVGLKKYLFEPNIYATHADIEGRIYAQIQKYLPFVSILDLSFVTGTQTDSNNHNALTIKLKYLIDPIAHIDVFVINSDLML